MIPPQLIIVGIVAIAGASTGFGAAWKWQAAKLTDLELAHEKQEKHRAEIDLENERLVAKTRTRNDQAVIHAVNDGLVRSGALRRDAAASRSSLDGLRDATATAVRDAATSVDACTQRAAALGELFSASAESYRELAEKADRHASDVRTLSEAWPR